MKSVFAFHEGLHVAYKWFNPFGKKGREEKANKDAHIPLNKLQSYIVYWQNIRKKYFGVEMCSHISHVFLLLFLKALVIDQTNQKPSPLPNFKIHPRKLSKRQTTFNLTIDHP